MPFWTVIKSPCTGGSRESVDIKNKHNQQQNNYYNNIRKVNQFRCIKSVFLQYIDNKSYSKIIKGKKIKILGIFLSINILCLEYFYSQVIH